MNSNRPPDEPTLFDFGDDFEAGPRDEEKIDEGPRLVDQETLDEIARQAEERRAKRTRDLREARAARDAGMGQAEENAPEGWSEYAYLFVENYTKRSATLFVDDLWDAGLERPPNPRALGPVIRRAARDGLIEKTGDYRPSVGSRLGPKPVWRSLAYNPNLPDADLPTYDPEA